MLSRRLANISRHLCATSYPATIASAAAGKRSNSFTTTAISTVSAFTTIPPIKRIDMSSHTMNAVETAACLIIGDEVLNGKTVDKNSQFFAKYCFSLGIDLKRIEVIGDVEEEIVEAAQRMSKNYDFVVTSGGIGPTHDDITYASLAKAFGASIEMHQETYERMKRLSKPKGDRPPVDFDTPSPALTARLRMVHLPTGPNCSAVFVSDTLWVPISIVNNNIHVLPGIPDLFREMLEGYRSTLQSKVGDSRNIHRILISTPMRESDMSGYLTDLQEKVKERGVKVGSYPKWGKPKNTVTLVGRDKEYMEGLVAEVADGLQGERIMEESDSEGEAEPKKKEDK